jgi:PiT family inorganic phosphate transporter
MIEALLVLAALLVTFSNGANDNFKGFATVWGSDTPSYRQALGLSTLATVAGSLTSLWLADGLVQSFSGKGLVPDAVVLAPAFLTAVALGAAGTVLLATRLGFPVSTTHALIGALIGAGLAQAGADVHWAALASAFMAPLLLSPLLAVALSVAAHRLFAPRKAQPDCACVVLPEPALQPGLHGVATARAALPQLVLASAAVCAPLDAPLRVSVPRSLDRLHVLSAMSICYARGVNDTPKLAALLLAAQVWDAQVSLLVLAAVMAAGGLLLSRRVAHTMSQRVTRMDHREGLSANIITAVLVLFASKLGLPVSTTHVAVGAIAGVGASAGTLNTLALRQVLLSWLATLPLAAVLAFVAAALL